MIDPNDPPRGSMYLYDAITPPTRNGSYQMTVSTNIDYGTPQSAPIDRFFDVVGPRFTMDPEIIANVFPPRNGQGAYQDALPQIVLKRRTLPWERRVDSNTNQLPLPHDNANPPNGDVPWLALLLFEEGEYSLLQNQRLEDIVPPNIFAALGSPQNILCDAVEVDPQLLRGILPSREELQLLCHVRQVNVEDRELNAGSSDGFFSVVMSNRLPAPDSICRACLVSLEQRTDLISADPPAFEYPGGSDIFGGGVVVGGVLEVASEAFAFESIPLEESKARLVLLHSWQFTVSGPGTFRTLMQRVDVGMIGKIEDETLELTDTGHLRLSLLDRAGEMEVCWYRGPLTPWQLTRDPLGPYHSADQCRRATPETGAEDVSYAAAFEVGRQLAASDARLAQELMRWRRESYRQAARSDTISKVQEAISVDLPATLAEKLQAPIAAAVSVSASQALAGAGLPIADRFGINVATKTLGTDAEVLRRAWSLASTAQAKAILGGEASTLGATVTEPPKTPRPNVTLEEVAADKASLDHLKTARDRLIQSARVKIDTVRNGGRR